MAADIEEIDCPDCGAPVLSAKIEDPLNLRYGNKEVVLLNRDLAVPDECALYRTYYSTGSGHYTERLRRENVHRRHSCSE